MKTLKTALLATLVLNASNLWAFDLDHQKFDKLVHENVVDSGVKYRALKEKQSELKEYLKDLAGVDEKEFKGWEKEDQLAFLVNLYNAATLNLVLENYPLKSLKEEVGGKDGPWKLDVVKVFGKSRSLDDLEHQVIRKNFAEPRIHFALNCASDGCPPLRQEAFVGDQLEKQLEEQTTKFLANKKANKLSGDTLTLSPIFDWFKEDFVKKSGSVEAFVNPYFPDREIKEGDVKITYSDYGWGLNEAE